MGKKTTKTSEASTSNSKVTPDVPTWIQQPQQDLTKRVNELISPERMEQFRPSVASPLQQQAFASQLGGGTQYLQDAAGVTRGLMGRGANTAGVTLAGLAPQGAVHSYSAAQGQARGYDAPQLGAVGQARAPTLAGLERVSMPMLAGLERVAGPDLGEIERIQAASYLDGGIDKHLNPYLSGVVDTTAADLDVNDGRVRAQQSAQIALNKGFGGSRMGLREAQTEGELSRARGNTLGGLRMGAYDRATSNAQEDAGRVQTTRSENARAANARAEARAALQTQVDTGNADRGARRGEFEGELGTRIGTTNAEMGARRGEFQGEMLAGLERFNTDLTARRQAEQAGLNVGAMEFTRGAENGFLSDLLRRQDESSQFLSRAENDRSNLSFTEGNRLGLSNAEFLNTGARFNVGQEDAALERDFRGAGMLADLGRGVSAEQRADTGMLAQLGQTQYDQQLAQQQHEMRMLAWAQGLGPDPRAYSGQTVVGSGTGTGKTTESDPMGAYLKFQAAGAQALAASDARLKQDIRTEARDPRGFRWVSWTWNALGQALGLYGPARRYGVLAQEVRPIVPNAVIEGRGGVLLVNYGALA